MHRVTLTVLTLLPLLALVAMPAAVASQGATPATTPMSAPADDGRDMARLVDVGGRSLYLECAGQGAPTVVLEAGLGESSATWDPLWSQVIALTRVCRYDRAGLGRSDPAPALPRTGPALVADLRAVLAHSEVGCPCVLMGHSIGGQLIRLYAGLHPDDVAGLVLIDATPLGLGAALGEILAAASPPAPAVAEEKPSGTPPPALEPLDVLAFLDAVNAAPVPPPVPIVVIVATVHADPSLSAEAIARLEVVWADLQAQQARDLGARRVVAEGSGHVVHRDQPAIVVDALRQVVAAVRSPETWATPPPATQADGRRDRSKPAT